MTWKLNGRSILVASTVAVVFAVLQSATALAAPGHLPGSQDELCKIASVSVQPLAEIKNTRDDNYNCLSVSIDGHAITALRVEAHSFTTDAHRAAIELIKIMTFSVSQIESSQGAVLEGVPGHEAIILRGNFSSGSGEAQLVTSYLYNGIIGEYRSCAFKIERGADATWRLVDRFERPISHITIRTRRIPLLGTVGIANLDGACA